jgi:hypothetical protein
MGEVVDARPRRRPRLSERKNDVTAGELLQRIAQTLKQHIGPAIDGEYPRTQAFMAAVVLEKLGRHLGLVDEHAAAETADLTVLLADVRQLLENGNVPATVSVAIDALAQTRDNAALCSLIEALYAARAVLGEVRFAALLGRIRQNLRRSIDRRMQVAA